MESHYNFGNKYGRISDLTDEKTLYRENPAWLSFFWRKAAGVFKGSKNGIVRRCCVYGTFWKTSVIH